MVTRMTSAKCMISLLVVLLLPSTVAASEGGGNLFMVDINVSDKAALQRGARTFTDYCLGCHSASYMRFKRLANDLDYSEEDIEQLLLPAGYELGDTIKSAMTPALANEAFGTVVPDLSLVARSRGEQWLYSYFLSFYADDSRKLGWNNTVFPNASMPNVLWELQGVQQLVADTEHDQEHGTEHSGEDTGDHAESADGHGSNPADQFELIEAGLQSPEEYQRTVQDLVTFLVYLSEPAQLQRHSMGVWVVLFLALFTFVAWLLKAEYWRDVH